MLTRSIENPMGAVVHHLKLLRSNSDCVLRNGKRLPAPWLAETAWVTKDSPSSVQKRPAAVLDLPEELLEAILPHLDHRDLFNLSQTSHRLNVLAVSGLMLSHASCLTPLDL